MSAENKTNTQNNPELDAVSPKTSSETIKEAIPSMDDFKDQIDRSFKKIVEGDLLKGTVIGITDTEVSLDLGTYAEGIIRIQDLSNDPSFSINEDVTLGEEMSAMVISSDDGHGNLLLSKKLADNLLAWDKLNEDLESKKIIPVKIAQAVKGGVVAYLYGVRGFIPASQLSISYVEDLETWVGKEIEVMVITADKEGNKLILSGKEVEIEKENKERSNKISKLTPGTVTTGIVEKIMPYGAFVNIDKGLTGLVHISQISEKRIKSPNEVIKEGETVTVKITEVKDGKISLSMKAVQDKEEVVDDLVNTPSSYQSGEEVTTSLESLLKNIKL